MVAGVEGMKATEQQRAWMAEITKRRIGMAGYAKIIGSLRAGQKSTSDLEQSHGVSRMLILQIMRHCQRAGVVHRCEWFRPAPHSRLVPMWALGRDCDISMPEYEEKTSRRRRAPSSLILLTTVMQMLEEHALSRAEIADELCMHIDSANRVVSVLSEAGLIYVASWHKPPIGHSVAEFRTGCKRDAPRPPHVGNSREAMRGYATRRKQRAMLHAIAGQQAPKMRPAA